MSADRLAFLAGMAKFAQEQNVDPVAFMKVAIIGRALQAAGRGASRLGKSLEQSGVKGTFGKAWGKTKKTFADAFPKKTAPTGGPLDAEFKSVDDAITREARKNLAKGTAGALGAGYAGGVAKDYYDMANMRDEYEMGLMTKLKLMLGIQDPASAFSPLNPFHSGYRK